MEIKFSRGMATGNSTVDLCQMCAHARIASGHSFSERMVHCQAFGHVPFRVADCNGFYPSNAPTIYDMEQVAWMLVTKKAGREVGFVSAKEYQRMREADDSIPPSR